LLQAFVVAVVTCISAESEPADGVLNTSHAVGSRAGTSMPKALPEGLRCIAAMRANARLRQLLAARDARLEASERENKQHVHTIADLKRQLKGTAALTVASHFLTGKRWPRAVRETIPAASPHPKASAEAADRTAPHTPEPGSGSEANAPPPLLSAATVRAGQPWLISMDSAHGRKPLQTRFQAASDRATPTHHGPAARRRGGGHLEYAVHCWAPGSAFADPACNCLGEAAHPQLGSRPTIRVVVGSWCVLPAPLLGARLFRKC